MAWGLPYSYVYCFNHISRTSIYIQGGPHGNASRTATRSDLIKASWSVHSACWSIGFTVTLGLIWGVIMHWPKGTWEKMSSYRYWSVWMIKVWESYRILSHNALRWSLKQCGKTCHKPPISHGFYCSCHFRKAGGKNRLRWNYPSFCKNLQDAAEGSWTDSHPRTFVRDSTVISLAPSFNPPKVLLYGKT